MGLYDIIRLELECPVTNEISIREIQIKLNPLPGLHEFKVGDRLEFAENMSDLWVRDRYICKFCEVLMDKKYLGWRSFPKEGMVSHHRKSDCPNGRPNLEEYSHPSYINLKNGILSEIISENEFKNRNLNDFLDL